MQLDGLRELAVRIQNYKYFGHSEGKYTTARPILTHIYTTYESGYTPVVRAEFESEILVSEKCHRRTFIPHKVSLLN
jgi:hypothetical protein